MFVQVPGKPPFIFLAKPAGQKIVTPLLQDNTQRAGIFKDRIDTKVLRWDSLRNQAWIKKVIAGLASCCTAMIAGQSIESYADGTTRDCVGALKNSIYTLPAEPKRIDRDAQLLLREGRLQYRFKSVPVAVRLIVDVGGVNARKTREHLCNGRGWKDGV